MAQGDYEKFISAPSGDTLEGFRFKRSPDGGGYAFMTAYTPMYPTRFIRFDQSGTPIWNKSIHFMADPTEPLWESRWTVTPDNGLLYWTGAHTSNVTPDSAVLDRVVVKLSVNGTIEWAKRFRSPMILPPVYYGSDNGILMPDGTLAIVLFSTDPFPPTRCIHALGVLPDGTPSWSLSWLTALTEDDNYLTLPAVVTTDGDLFVAKSAGSGPVGEMELAKISPNGQVLWRKRMLLGDQLWSVHLESLVAGANGGAILNGETSALGDNHNWTMWLDANGDVYRHRREEDQEYQYLHHWEEDGTWWWRGWGWAIMDTAASAIDHRVELLEPPQGGPPYYGYNPVQPEFEGDSLWISGLFTTYGQFNVVQDEKPYVMRVTLPANGCNITETAGAAINVSDIPDSLRVVSDLPLPPTYMAVAIDTAMVMVDHPLNATYDICSYLSVSEQMVPPSDRLPMPNPAVDHITLIMGGESLDQVVWTIHDVMGRSVLSGTAIPDLPTTINIASIPSGTYTVAWSGHAARGAARFIKQ
jgi:hypothetical protein